MDRGGKFQGLYKGRRISYSSQRNKLRLSHIEQDMENENPFSEDEGYLDYVEASKSKQRRRPQSSEPGEARRKNQEGIRRFRRRANS